MRPDVDMTDDDVEAGEWDYSDRAPTDYVVVSPHEARGASFEWARRKFGVRLKREVPGAYDATGRWTFLVRAPEQLKKVVDHWEKAALAAHERVTRQYDAVFPIDGEEDMNATKKTIVNAIKNNIQGPNTLAYLRGATSLPDGTLRRNLTELKAAGQVTNEGGAWKVPA